MTKTRGIFGLQLAVGATGVGVTGLALFVAFGAVTLEAPAGRALLTACRSFALPQLSFGAVIALGLGSAALAVLGLAASSAVRQVLALRRFFATLRRVGPSPHQGAALFADERPQAFCAGLLHPRVYVSTGAVEILAPEELDAVLAHEHHHAHHHDPLRLFLARMLSDSLFFLPVLRRLADRYAAVAELAADAAAVQRHRGDSRALAGALLAFDGRASSAVVGIAPERVDHLLGQRARWELPLALLAWSVVVVLALLVITLRVQGATAHAAMSLPLVAAQLCMAAMAVGPPLAGASALLASGRLGARLRK